MSGGLAADRNPRTGGAIRSGLVVKTDPDGEILWQATLRAEDYTMLHFSSAAVGADGTYFFFGQATREGERTADMLWVKADCGG